MQAHSCPGLMLTTQQQELACQQLRSAHCQSTQQTWIQSRNLSWRQKSHILVQIPAARVQSGHQPADPASSRMQNKAGRAPLPSLGTQWHQPRRCTALQSSLKPLEYLLAAPCASCTSFSQVRQQAACKQGLSRRQMCRRQQLLCRSNAVLPWRAIGSLLSYHRPSLQAGRWPPLPAGTLLLPLPQQSSSLATACRAPRVVLGVYLQMRCRLLLAQLQCCLVLQPRRPLSAQMSSQRGQTWTWSQEGHTPARATQLRMWTGGRRPVMMWQQNRAANTAHPDQVGPGPAAQSGGMQVLLLGPAQHDKLAASAHCCCQRRQHQITCACSKAHISYLQGAQCRSACGQRCLP